MKRMMSLRTAVLCACAASLLLLAGCATILSKSTYEVSINSYPAPANVLITDHANEPVFKGITPTTVELRSSAGYFKAAKYQIKLSLPGYADRIIPITATLDGTYWLNAFFFGLIGMLTVDPATGAMYSIKNSVFNEVLFPLSEGQQAPSTLVSDSTATQKADTLQQPVKKRETEELYLVP
ncbi:MAG: hypothetical protein LBM06_05925 [Prevotellaceae bacterium]|jgi:hypothetical protein|nr:hypothetical protein [Prevotellaceae bacterium]